jgi:hypothetical protein
MSDFPPDGLSPQISAAITEPPQAGLNVEIPTAFAGGKPGKRDVGAARGSSDR